MYYYKISFLKIILFVLFYSVSYGQTIMGTIKNQTNQQPVAYVNIGVLNKNCGTVTDVEGKFSFLLAPNLLDTDTVLVSCIGYKSLSMKLIDFKNTPNILMSEKNNDLNEVVIRPAVYKTKILGYDTDSRNVSAGFTDNVLGYELGVLMKNKKKAFLKKISFNISACQYDTIFYRINVYEKSSEGEFINILQKPIYITFAKSSIKDKVVVDVEKENIVTQGDFLVTLEHIKNLGGGGLTFCAKLLGKTYHRKTSQAQWELEGMAGISLHVEADIEK